MKETKDLSISGKSESVDSMIQEFTDTQEKTICQDKLREKAYLKWEAAGCPCGSGEEFWIQAEQELTES